MSSDSLVIRSVKVQIDSAPRSIMRKFDNREFDFTEKAQILESIEYTLFAHGYIAHNFTEKLVGDSLILEITSGKAYNWETLILNEEVRNVMRSADVKVNRFERKPVSPQRIESLMGRAISYLENNGYPFAKLYFDSLLIDDDGISATLKMDKGRLVRIDSVVIHGDLKIRKSYITNYVGVKEGGVYDELAIKRIPQKIEALRFASQVMPPTISFQEDLTKVNIYLNKAQASSFDGIVGFLPDNFTGRILITGDVKLHLENALKQGEMVDLNWRKLQTNTQELNVELVSPFVLNSPVSLDGNLKIYRRDTLFTDVFRQLGVRYVFGSGDYFRLFADRQTTNLISTAQYEDNAIVPQFLDRAITSYGLGLKIVNLDYLLNPSKGFSLQAEVGAGNKEIVVNQKLPAQIYDSLELRTLQIRARLDAGYYVSPINRLVWHQQLLSAWLVNDQLFNNEAYRIGGLKTLRGFDEESIFATNYAIFKSELRYQMDRDGYVFAFFDGAWYENMSLNNIGVKRDVPYGFGAGISFGTKAGIFSLSYALGSQQNNPILLRASKVHFGFISIF